MPLHFYLQFWNVRWLNPYGNIDKFSFCWTCHGFAWIDTSNFKWISSLVEQADIHWKIILTMLIGSFISLVILFFIAFQPSQILVIFALGLLPYIAWMVPKELLDVTKPAIGVLAGGVVVGTNLVAGVEGLCLMSFKE